MKGNTENSYIPISHTYPQSHPARMDFSQGSKRKPPRADLREQVLKRETKRQQSGALSDLVPASNLSQEAMNFLEVKKEPAAMPTDFSAFNATLRPSDALGARPAGPPVLPTFQDLTTARSAEASEEQRNAASQAYLQVTRSFSMKAEDRQQAAAAQEAEPSGQQAAAEAAGSSLGRYQLQGLACPAMDWSLKSSVRVLSSSAFPGLTPATLCATRPVSRAREHLAQPSACCASSELPEALPAALHSWQHPGSSFSGEAVAELQAAAAGKQLLQQRLAAWRRSLRSLYYQLRHGGCQAFYVVAQQGHKVPFTALFTAAGGRGSSRPLALVSQSSTALRNRLLRLQLQHSMPGHPQHQEQQQQQAQHDGHTSLPAKYDGTARSQLCFEGEAAVHGLFDVLYTESGFSAWGEAGTDLPVLLAPVPFEGSSLQQPTVRLVHGSVVGVGGEAGGEAGGGHKLEVSGLVPGWAAQRLLLVLAAAGCQQYTAHLVTAAASETLNRQQGSSSAAGRQAWLTVGGGLAGAGSSSELEQWQSPLQQLSGGVVSEVLYRGGEEAEGGSYCCRVVHQVAQQAGAG